MSHFYKKYLKYKRKYLYLKNQLGSGIYARYTMTTDIGTTRQIVTLYYNDKDGKEQQINYTIEEIIGSGSYGIVYKLRNSEDQNFYIIKIGNSTLLEGIMTDNLKGIIDNDMLVLFQGNQEKEFLIAKYNGINLEEEYYKNLLKIKYEFISTTTQILQLLSRINKRGFFHNDIRLVNLTIKNKKVYLIDFGLMKTESSRGCIISISVRSILDDIQIEYPEENINYILNNLLKPKLKSTDIFGFFFICIDLLGLYVIKDFSLIIITKISNNVDKTYSKLKLFYAYYFILPEQYRIYEEINAKMDQFDILFPSLADSICIFGDINPEYTNLFRFMTFIYNELIDIPDVYRIDRNNFINFLRVLSDCLLPDFDYDLFIPKFKAAVNLLFQNNLENGFTINSVAFAPSGTLLAIGLDNGTVNLWSISLENSSSRLEDTNELLYHRVMSVVFHPSSPFVVTNYSNFYEPNGIVKLWRILNKKLVEYLIIDPCIFVFSVRFNLTGNILATSCSDGTVKLWSILYSENPSATCDVVLDKHSKYAISVGFDPTGTLIATGYDDGIVKIWKISEGKKSVEFVADIQRYIEEEEEEELPELVTQEGFHNAVFAVEFNPTGSLLVACYNDGTFTIWNISKDKKLFMVWLNIKNNKLVKSVIFHPILPYMAICYENIVEISRIEDEISFVLKIEWQNYFNSIAFHPTEPVLVTASSDHTAKLWYFPTEL